MGTRRGTGAESTERMRNEKPARTAFLRLESVITSRGPAAEEGSSFLIRKLCLST